MQPTTTHTHLAIFDLDGTLAESGEANTEAYRRAFTELGLTFDADLYQQMVGAHWTHSLPRLHPGGSPEVYAALRSAKSRHYSQLTHLLAPLIPIVQRFESLGSSHYRAVVTSASRGNAEAALTRLGLLAHLDLLITGDDVTQAKPHPEGFLRAMKHFNIPPSHTEIYEDSEQGLTAAHASGAANVIDVATLL